MTKLLRITTVALAISLIVVFLLAGLSMQKLIQQSMQQSVQQKNTSLESLTARKEDLLSEQQKIETLITQLNKTIQYEAARQKSLTEKILALNKSQGSLQNGLAQINMTIPKTTPQPPTTPTPPSSPSTPTPTPPPVVTRAS